MNFWDRILGPRTLCQIDDGAAPDAGASDQADFDADPIGSLNALADDLDETTEGEEKPEGSAKGDETVPAHIQARIDKAEERAIAAEQTNKFLQGKMSGIESQLANLGKKENRLPRSKQNRFSFFQRKKKSKGCLKNPIPPRIPFSDLFNDFGKGIEERFGGNLNQQRNAVQISRRPSTLRSRVQSRWAIGSGRNRQRPRI